jgi:quercetin dioxygenase-like cupin family protein
MVNARILRGPEGDIATGGGISWLFKAGAKRADGFDFLVGDVTYLSGPPLHHHRDQVDTFYILENILKVQVEDEFFDLGPGDFASVPPGVRHTFDNVWADQPPVKAVNLMVPGGLDLFLEQLGELGDQPADDEVNRVGARSGVTFVGPPLRVTLGLTER